MTFRGPWRSLLGALLAVATSGWAGVTVDELPLSSGPYAPAPPGPVRTIEQDGRRLMLPAPAAMPEQLLGVRVAASFRWSSLTRGIRGALSGGERALLVHVRDPGGAEQLVRIDVDARLMEPILFPDTAILAGDEDVLQLRRRRGALVILHGGMTLAPADVPSALDAAFSAVGDLFFPVHETPAKAEFPVWIFFRGAVPVEDVVDVLSRVQGVAYSTALARLRPGG